MKVISWFSCGAPSAVMTKILLKEYPDTRIAYCDTGSEHPDNMRFLMDCEKWFGRKVEGLKGDYDSVDEVIDDRKYLAGINGAPCTAELKRVPRLRYQEMDDIQAMGYTTDERKRAKRFTKNNPELNVIYPLIKMGMSEYDCHALLREIGIELPVMYKLGFRHNNCLGCVKSGSAKYWDLTRRHFPEVFQRRCEQSRKYGARLLQMKSEETGEFERYFLDELPELDYFPDEPEHTCDFLCQSISEDIK